MNQHRSKDGRFILDPAKTDIACQLAVHNAVSPAPYVPTWVEKNPPIAAALAGLKTPRERAEA